MKRLVLMRHADSDNYQPGRLDHHRLLSERGRHDAAEMGKLLHAQGIVLDAIFCSAAKRTRETLALVLENIPFADEPHYSDALYNARIRDYVTLLSDLPATTQTAMIVGHNPTMASAFEFFSDRFQSFPTAAVAYLEFEIDDWENLLAEPIGTLLGYWEPYK